MPSIEKKTSWAPVARGFGHGCERMGTLKAFRCYAVIAMVQSSPGHTAHFTDRTTDAMAKVPKSVHKWLSKIGTKGGSVSSPAKVAAVRENGKLGGRPRKKVAQ